MTVGGMHVVHGSERTWFPVVLGRLGWAAPP